MDDDHVRFSWSSARESARQRRVERAPRRAAIADAVAAVRPMKDESPAVLHAALVREFGARGIADATPGEVDLYVRVIRSPRRAAVGHIVRMVRLVGATAGLLRDILRGAQPRWTYTPDGTPSLETWRSDQQEVLISIDPADLPDARSTLTRLFADLPHEFPDEIGPDEVRPFACWLSWNPAAGARSAVTMHIGTFTIGEIPDDHADLARLLITEHGGDMHAIDIVAEALGQDVETGRLHLFLPDRP